MKNPADRIKLENILSHPFMTKSVKQYDYQYPKNDVLSSVDSGFLTMSSKIYF